MLVEDRSYTESVLADHGVKFAIENHPEKSPREVLEVIDGSDWIGSCPDTGWWAIQGYEPAAAIREQADTILTVHLKDIDPETGKGRRPGTGAVDIEACLRALSDIGYDGAVGVEHEPDGWDPTDDLTARHTSFSRVGRLTRDLHCDSGVWQYRCPVTAVSPAQAPST